MDRIMLAFDLLILGLLTLALCWLLYQAYRRIRALELDNSRLLRRLGEYHAIPLGPVRPPQSDVPAVPLGIPPAFRIKRPVPPGGKIS
jgi:hypothetical protein